MRTLILAGGLGTRLRELIDDRPKPMALVAGRPFLEYLVLQLKIQDLTDIVLCIGYLGEQIQAYFEDGRRWGVDIQYSQEQEPLGTGGAVNFAHPLIREKDFLVMNGDSFLSIDLNELVECHLKKRRALATLALAKTESPERYGVVELSKRSGMIIKFVEKDRQSEPESRLINAGVYAFHRRIFDFIPEGKVSLEDEVFPRLVGQRFYGMPIEGAFIDIGVPEDYERLSADPEMLLKYCRDCM